MFVIKEKSIILTHTMAIATNIAVLLMTAFVLQGHILSHKLDFLRTFIHNVVVGGFVSREDSSAVLPDL